MGRRGDDLLVAYKDMDKLRSLVHKGFCNSSKRLFTASSSHARNMCQLAMPLNGLSVKEIQHHFHCSMRLSEYQFLFKVAKSVLRKNRHMGSRGRS